MAHVFVKPENTTAMDGENVHIFPAEKKLGGYRVKSQPHCNHDKVLRIPKTGFIAKDTDTEALDYATELNSKDKKVCGNCISYIHGDNNDKN